MITRTNTAKVYDTVSGTIDKYRPKTVAEAATGLKSFFGQGFALLGKGLKFSFCNVAAPAHIKLALGLAGAGLAVVSMTSGMRTFTEANNALKMKGNHYGSTWYSGVQTGLHALSFASIPLAFLIPPFGAVAMTCPALLAAPSAISLGMDYFQDMCTNPNNWINKMGQFGLTNFMLDSKIGDGNFTTFRPKMLNWWVDNVRSKDEAFAKSWFGVDLDRPEIAKKEAIRPGWMV